MTWPSCAPRCARPAASTACTRTRSCDVAVAELDLDLAAELVGPTAIAFVGQKPDGTPGDPVMVAKALSTFAKAHPHLVIKGGLLDTTVLDADGAKALATVAPREELLARFAGGLAAPMRNMAALLQAVPLKFAYGLQALIEAGGAAGETELRGPRGGRVRRRGSHRHPRGGRCPRGRDPCGRRCPRGQRPRRGGR